MKGGQLCRPVSSDCTVLVIIRLNIFISCVHYIYLSGNTWLQSSQLAEPLGTDPGLRSGISVHELISTSKKRKEKKKSAAGGMIGRTFSPNPSK